MANLLELTAFLNDLLELDRFPHDPSNNGLQFQGAVEVRKAVFAVDASAAVFTTAADLDADFVFVHHGLSWGPGCQRWTGHLATRLSLLAANGISLYAAHLPLDAHELCGHNILLAGMLGLQNPVPFGRYHDSLIGFRGELPRLTTVRQLAAKLDAELPSEGAFTIIGNAGAKVRHVGVISGGGAWPELFDEIDLTPVECLVTGAMTHESFHPALESAVTVLTLGHYRSETPGVIAVMNSVREHFGIDVEFVDLPTGL